MRQHVTALGVRLALSGYEFNDVTKYHIYGNGMSVYIHIWQIRDVTNRQLFTGGY